MNFLFYKNLNLIKIKWFIYLSVSISLMTIHFISGPISSPDTYYYSRLADLLINNNLDFYSYIIAQPAKIFYFVTVTIFAIAKVISKEYWEVIILALNSACIPVIILLASRIVHLTKLNKYLAAFFPLIFLFSADYLIWAKYVLTDTIYSLLVIWCLYVVTLSLSKDNRGWKVNLIFIVSILLLILSRPVYPPVVLVLCFFYFVPTHIIKRKHVISVLLISVPIIFLAFAALLKSNIPDALNIEILKFSIGMIKDGVIIHDRPETYIVHNYDYVSIFKILCTRFLYFFAPYSNSFSMLHIIINAIFFVIVALPILISEIFVDRRRVKNHIVLQTKAILMSLIIATAVFHSIILIDYDWRYRYPTIALMILLATIEISLFLQQKLSTSKES